MSGYESIRDWAFDEYDIFKKKYSTFQIWLDDIESDFDLNGRGIPLRKIFDIQDFIDLENEWNKRKGIEEKEDEDDDVDPPLPPEEQEENVIEKFVKEKFIEPIVKTVNRIRGLFGL